MANYLADTRTNGQVTQLHAGLNAIISKLKLSETLSGSTTVELAVLPGGARVTGMQFLCPTAGTAEGSVAITAQGLTYVGTASVASSIVATGAGLGQRLTSDATLSMRFTGAGGTGRGSSDFTVITQYLTDQVKD